MHVFVRVRCVSVIVVCLVAHVSLLVARVTVDVCTLCYVMCACMSVSYVRYVCLVVLLGLVGR